LYGLTSVELALTIGREAFAQRSLGVLVIDIKSAMNLSVANLPAHSLSEERIQPPETQIEQYS